MRRGLFLQKSSWYNGTYKTSRRENQVETPKQEEPKKPVLEEEELDFYTKIKYSLGLPKTWKISNYFHN